MKEKANTKVGELNVRVKTTEEKIAEKTYEILENPNAENELRQLSVELDLVKRQLSAMTNESRKTVIVNCRKEIERVKRAYKELAIQHRTLHLLYNKYFGALSLVEMEAKKQ